MAFTGTAYWLPAVRFAGAMLRALGDESTYSVRKNPSLWLGFLLAIPIPLLTWMADSALWLRLMTLPAPFFWGLILGAAGRVGMIAKQERDILAGEVRRVESVARETAAHLGEERSKREALEDERKEVVSELKLARAVQATLLPQPIERPDVEVVATLVPTRFVGGDYVHANVVEDRWLYLCIVDVSGHGISAALVVARVHGMVRRLTLTAARPAEMLERLNQAALGILRHTYFFMTAVFARIDLGSGRMEYASAGHPAQLLLRSTGDIEELQTPNRLLGMHAAPMDANRPSASVQLEPGDSIVFFTDGLFELLSDGAGELLGEEGLKERIRGLEALAPQLLIGEVLQELADFQGRTAFDDDVTMLVARYLGPPPETGPRS